MQVQMQRTQAQTRLVLGHPHAPLPHRQQSHPHPHPHPHSTSNSQNQHPSQHQPLQNSGSTRPPLVPRGQPQSPSQFQASQARQSSSQAQRSQSYTGAQPQRAVLQRATSHPSGQAQRAQVGQAQGQGPGQGKAQGQAQQKAQGPGQPQPQQPGQPQLHKAQQIAQQQQAQEVTRAEQRRLKLREIENELAAEEAEAIKMTEEQRQTLLRSFTSVKVEFSDLDGLRWTQAALSMFQRILMQNRKRPHLSSHAHSHSLSYSHSVPSIPHSHSHSHSYSQSVPQPVSHSHSSSHSQPVSHSNSHPHTPVHRKPPPPLGTSTFVNQNQPTQVQPQPQQQRHQLAHKSSVVDEKHIGANANIVGTSEAQDEMIIEVADAGYLSSSGESVATEHVGSSFASDRSAEMMRGVIDVKEGDVIGVKEASDVMDVKVKEESGVEVVMVDGAAQGVKVTMAQSTAVTSASAVSRPKDCEGTTTTPDARQPTTSCTSSVVSSAPSPSLAPSAFQKNSARQPDASSDRLSAWLAQTTRDSTQSVVQSSVSGYALMGSENAYAQYGLSSMSPPTPGGNPLPRPPAPFPVDVGSYLREKQRESEFYRQREVERQSSRKYVKEREGKGKGKERAQDENTPVDMSRPRRSDTGMEDCRMRTTAIDFAPMTGRSRHSMDGYFGGSGSELGSTATATKRSRRKTWDKGSDAGSTCSERTVRAGDYSDSSASASSSSSAGASSSALAHLAPNITHIPSEPLYDPSTLREDRRAEKRTRRAEKEMRKMEKARRIASEVGSANGEPSKGGLDCMARPTNEHWVSTPPPQSSSPAPSSGLFECESGRTTRTPTISQPQPPPTPVVLQSSPLTRLEAPASPTIKAISSSPAPLLSISSLDALSSGASGSLAADGSSDADIELEYVDDDPTPMPSPIAERFDETVGFGFAFGDVGGMIDFGGAVRDVGADVADVADVAAGDGDVSAAFGDEVAAEHAMEVDNHEVEEEFARVDVRSCGFGEGVGDGFSLGDGRGW
ncbi:hypothetical protein BJ165DRAFT_1410281 [Panaeolus papilionaceus]|nr:hypothetical protein BJ165DRAFT_1410281 [Panaeolus papilionaceus]